MIDSFEQEVQNAQIHVARQLYSRRHKKLLKENASARVAAAKAAFESAGAKLESVYFAFGADDLVAIVDAPDNITAAALSVTFGAAGMIRGRTIPLLTVEEMDKALAKKVSYQAPGSAR